MTGNVENGGLLRESALRSRNGDQRPPGRIRQLNMTTCITRLPNAEKQTGRYARPGSASSGFTIIELAIALFIVTLLLGSVLVPLQTQVEQRQITDTQKTLEDVKEALLGYAIATGHLPCPDRTSGGTGGANDTANDGIEDFNAGLCIGAVSGTVGPPNRQIVVGNVPWVTLGLGAQDPWGNRLRYVVDFEFASRSPAAGFTLSGSADIVVCANALCTVRLTPLPSGPNPGDAAVAVILSLGKNGYGAINAATGTQRPLPSGMDELINVTNGTASFVSRVKTGIATGACDGPGQPLCEFDDVVSWMGKYTLYNRMVASGRLP